MFKKAWQIDFGILTLMMERLPLKGHPLEVLSPKLATFPSDSLDQNFALTVSSQAKHLYIIWESIKVSETDSTVYPNLHSEKLQSVYPRRTHGKFGFFSLMISQLKLPENLMNSHYL